MKEMTEEILEKVFLMSSVSIIIITGIIIASTTDVFLGFLIAIGAVPVNIFYCWKVCQRLYQKKAGY